MIKMVPSMITLSEEQPGQIETLRGLMDRLCSPNLTLGEAKVLRNELLDLLERIDSQFPQASIPRKTG